jgi:DNA polymerase-3 subunit delta'|tara:strand:- start:42 stop:968 length:927 start_codon:yes stop_codon:yes gene_type:complete
MNNQFFYPKKTLKLFSFKKEFDFFKKLFVTKKLPRVNMITGKKGLGKFTFINHFLCYVFDKENYDINNKIIDEESMYYKKINSETFSNVITLSNDKSKIKIDDIRLLKTTLNKTFLNDTSRFIILDNIENYNHNALNALLKIIEEPSDNNYFFLINSREKPILETIKSRCVETKFFLSEDERIKIIEYMIKLYSIKSVVDYKKIDVTPGNFLKFNYLCLENNIDMKLSYFDKIYTLLRLYKKNKDLNLIKVANFFTDLHFYNLSIKNKNHDFINDTKYIALKNIDNFVLYNLNLNVVIQQFNKDYNYE